LEGAAGTHHEGVEMKLQIAAALAVTVLSTFAHARGPCTADIEKLCADVKPGDGRVAACLDAHASELSNNCKSDTKARKGYIAGWTDTCKADKDKFCKDVKAGNGRVAACLADHFMELTVDCHNKFLHGNARVMRINEKCGKDIKASCASASTHSAKINCLGEHMDAASDQCKIEMDDVL
jgi:hypothetical protein